MKKTYIIALLIVTFISNLSIIKVVQAIPITFPINGGTGTSVKPTLGQVLVGQIDGTYSPQATSTLGITGGGGGSGTVTSVGLTVPTGLTISGSPVTTSGTLAVSLTAGYNIPLTASTTNWNNFFNTPSGVITSGTGLSWSGNTLNTTAAFGTVNSGLLGQIPYYAANGTTLTATSTIFLKNQNVGIGTTTPGSALTVAGNGFFTGNITSANITATGTLSVTGVTTLGNITGSTQCLHVNSSGVVSGTGADCGAGGSSQWTTSGSNIYYTTGKVGVGTSTFPYTLSVGGNIGVTDIYSNGFFFGNATSTGGSSIVLGSVHDIGSLLGANNFVAGAGAGQFSTGGSNNILIGSTAGSNTTGGDNVFLGDQAGTSNTSGGGNVFLGKQAGTSNDTGIDNVFLGLAAGSGNVTGADNVFLGTGAGTSLTGGSENVAIGRSAGASLDTGANNSFLGYQAGVSSTGANNTFFGVAAGAGATSGSYNIAIGNGADVLIASGDQQLNIGNLIYGTGVYNGGGHSSTPANGKVGIGTTTPASTLDVVGGIYSESQTPATSTSMTIDFSTASNEQVIKIGTANITVSFTNSANVTGKRLVVDVVAPASGVIGSTTFSGVVWDGGINPGNSVLNGSTDRFVFVSSASSTKFISGDLVGTY